MELWDAYDINFNLLPDRVLVRGEKLPQNVFHLVCDVIVRHTDGEYLLMKRDPRKAFGGMWEATAGGSALQGETPLDCAHRELLEETGIDGTNFCELGRVISHRTGGFNVQFLCVTDVAKDSIVFQEGETVDYKWVTLEELSALTRKELCTERMQLFLPELREYFREKQC